MQKLKKKKEKKERLKSVDTLKNVCPQKASSIASLHDNFVLAQECL